MGIERDLGYFCTYYAQLCESSPKDESITVQQIQVVKTMLAPIISRVKSKNFRVKLQRFYDRLDFVTTYWPDPYCTFLSK